MLNRLLRETWTKVMTPIARLFLRLGISPDVVTVVGTVGVCVGALVFFPRGQLLVGTLVVALFIFSDNVDGVMARMSGRQGPWGAYLDSTLDRIGDAAIFGGLVLYFAGPGDNYLYLCLSLYCLVMGAVTSYARARAESLGMQANRGIAERADRTVAILLAAGVSDWWNLPILLEITLWVLAVAITITVLQRVWMVRKQAMADAAPS